MPPNGPKPGWESSTTGAKFASGERAPAMDVARPAWRRMERPWAIRGWPASGSKALSDPMRLESPPARTKPTASEESTRLSAEASQVSKSRPGAPKLSSVREIGFNAAGLRCGELGRSGSLPAGLSVPLPPGIAQSIRSPVRSSSNGTSRWGRECCRRGDRSPSSR